MNNQQSSQVQLKRVKELEPGMVLARAIYSSNGCRLLNEGKILNRSDIDRLKKFNKRRAYVQKSTNGKDESSLAAAS